MIWLSTTGDVLNAAQQTAFEDYIRAGGGYTGIHAAADTEYEWSFYTHLVGASFRNHPAGTPTATVHVEDTDDHSTQGLPAPNWERVDEWYNYQSPDSPSVGGGGTDYSPRPNVHVLISLDETTYDEDDGNTTDDDHPISWCQRYEGGRSWYTGMGHTDESFSEANYLKHILGGIEVSAGVAPSEECGATDPGAPVVQGFADPATGPAPLEVQFSSTAADPDGDALIYRWTFGDGGSALGSNPVHTYTKPGSYTATVTVRDPDGNVGTDTVQITVNAPGNQIPMVVTAADPTEGNAPLPVRFQAAGDRSGRPGEPARLPLGLRRRRRAVRPQRPAHVHGAGHLQGQGQGDRRGRRHGDERGDHHHGDQPARQHGADGPGAGRPEDRHGAIGRDVHARRRATGR